MIQQRDTLVVPEGAVNYGYLTRAPVDYKPAKYGKQAQLPALDANHSHFILVSTTVKRIPQRKYGDVPDCPLRTARIPPPQNMQTSLVNPLALAEPPLGDTAACPPTAFHIRLSGPTGASQSSRRRKGGADGARRRWTTARRGSLGGRST